MATLAAGGVLAAVATAWMGEHVVAGIGLAILAFSLIGAGVAAAGTALLALLAASVVPVRRGAAATIVWLMMIAGFAVTAGVAGGFLDPFSPQRLVAVTSVVSAIALTITLIALVGLERPRPELEAARADDAPKPPFRVALREVWQDDEARRFTIFVFMSMLAYNLQDLILEPFGGTVFAMTPGETTRLAGVQHGGVLAGMLLVAFAVTWVGRGRLGSLKAWTVGGCVASAVAFVGLITVAMAGPGWPLSPFVLFLGVANGTFAVAAIGTMMTLAGGGRLSGGGIRLGVWGAAQAFAFGIGGFVGTVAIDATRALFADPATAYALVFALEGATFLVAARIAAGVGRTTSKLRPGAARCQTNSGMTKMALANFFDVVVVGGGPAGATAATDLAKTGASVLLLDRAGRIKPCGGAIPPRLVRDFDIPAHLLVAQVSGAKMVGPSGVTVDMPIEDGYVGMVDRDTFDEWLRVRAEQVGVTRRTGTFKRIERDADGSPVVVFEADGAEHSVPTRAIVGADGARSKVAISARIPKADRIPCVFAYHEIVKSPEAGSAAFDPTRCDVYYQGRLSPDFYAWVFPHGETTSVGVGSAIKGFSLRRSVDRLRADTGLQDAQVVRREGAPIPLRPLKRWDNRRDVVLAGDAAGVVAPASGEGIYYAMLTGRLAADSVAAFLRTGDAAALATAQRSFRKAHGRVFTVLGIMQWFWYRSDRFRERFVLICRDPDVQRLTWQAYMNKELVRRDPLAHLRVFFKDVAHIFRMASHRDARNS